MRIHYSIVAVAAGLSLAAAYLLWRPQGHAASVDDVIKRSWTRATPEWQARLVQDETQKVCSQYRNAPPKEVADAIVAREKATIQYPPDGKLTGDWKKGERLAQSGYGGRFTDYPPRQENGGNCYACHQLSKSEIAYGTIGPSLYRYGANRGVSDPASPAAKAVVDYTWGKLWNSKAYNACSNMPRAGHSGILTEAQIRDVMALLLDPKSPVNQ
jgi:L-cysteine S-thiosulfotransferase